MSKGWDSIALKKLKALTGKGLSTSEIGKRLGMSKNAIVGKLNRMGWNAKAGGAAVAKDTETKAKTKKTTEKTVEKKTAVKTTKVKEVAKKTTTAKVSAKKATEVKKTEKKAAEKVKVSAPNATTKSVKTDVKSLAMHQRIIQHSLEMANLKPNQCRWPIGDPDSEHFHFCGETVFVGKPYCYEHCKQAYQFTPPKKK